MSKIIKKRKLLNEENKKVYEEMLLYVRLFFNKSEQESEEILMELLDHLLDAQGEGKSAKEVFGDDPRQYANEIIGELPKMITPKRVKVGLMAIFYFLAVTTFLNGVVHSILYFGFGKGDQEKIYYIGTLALEAITSIIIVFVAMYAIFAYLKWSCFKDINKVLESVLFGFCFGALPFGLFLTMFIIMPDFGMSVQIPVYWLIGISIVFYVLATYFKKTS